MRSVEAETAVRRGRGGGAEVEAAAAHRRNGPRGGVEEARRWRNESAAPCRMIGGGGETAELTDEFWEELTDEFC